MAANYKLILIMLFVSLFLTPFAAALGNMDFSISVPTAKIIPYTGGQTNAAGSVRNDNWLCNIECTYSTSQGNSGNIGAIEHGATTPFVYTVSAQGTSSPINVQITVHCVAPGCSNEGSREGYTSVSFKYCGDGGSPDAGENCGSCPSDVICSSGYHCEGTNCVRDPYCGDTNCGGSETCSNCPSDCRCGQYEKCIGGTCKTYCGNGKCDSGEDCSSCSIDCKCGSDERCESGTCRTYCGNGKCEINENCASCPTECQCSSEKDCSPGTPKADLIGCIDKCGNGKVEFGEDCKTCFPDAGCKDGTYCSPNGNCEQCLRDEHCKSSEEIRTDETTCASDDKSILRTWIKKSGVCHDYKCTGEEEKFPKPDEQCGNKLCQDGHCGCSEGYSTCLITGKCEKIGTLEDGSSCGCFDQCKSNYCSKSGKCMRALNTILAPEKNLISVGEDTTVTISADNSMDFDILTKLTLNIDTGASMTGTIGGADCTGNQCTGGQIKVPAKGRTSVEVKITGQSAAKVKLTSVITSVIEGKEYPKTEEVFITVMDAGDGKCTEGENPQNDCKECTCLEDTSLYAYTCGNDNSCHKNIGWWVYVALGIVVLVTILIYFGATKGRTFYAKMKRENEIKESLKKREEKLEEAKKEKERGGVITALSKIRKKIDIDEPLTVDEVIKELNMSGNEILIEEEYMNLLDRMREEKERIKIVKPKEEVIKEKSSFFDRFKGEPKKESVEKEEKPKEAKKVTVKFCPKCGADLRGGIFCPKCGMKVER